MLTCKNFVTTIFNITLHMTFSTGKSMYMRVLVCPFNVILYHEYSSDFCIIFIIIWSSFYLTCDTPLKYKESTWGEYRWNCSNQKQKQRPKAEFMGMFMSQIYWCLEFLFSGGRREGESHERKDRESSFWNNIRRLSLMIIKRMLLFMSSIAFIVNFYYVEGH